MSTLAEAEPPVIAFPKCSICQATIPNVGHGYTADVLKDQEWIRRTIWVCRRHFRNRKPREEA
jgi:hypothetical protein